MTIAVDKAAHGLASQVVAGGSSDLTVPITHPNAPDLSDPTMAAEIADHFARILAWHSGGQLTINWVPADTLGFAPSKLPALTGTVVTAQCDALPDVAPGQERMHCRVIIDPEAMVCRIELQSVTAKH